ncbi:hypothetical protein E2C01_027665 [Portunus trituberculatus]|uniref:Uncharacterized protein n=1 Tax=Portunus trituberculatus TaxID=210409 RepID=A0A5B7EIQ1_PORTR|nr:hypothetical protein [Portunus trituberculatus]
MNIRDDLMGRTDMKGYERFSGASLEHPSTSHTRDMLLLVVVGERCDEGDHGTVEPGDGTWHNEASIIVAKVATMLSLDV